MRKIDTDPLDRTRFPIDPWRLVETYPSESDLGVTETLFAVGNGYLGMRGNPEEGRRSYAHGTFINGFHETWKIQHAEEAFGFAQTGQTIVNVPDAKLMKIYVDDEPLMLSVADLDSYERWLDFRDATLNRELVWRTPSGKRVRVSSRRAVSFTDRHLAVCELIIEMLDGEAPVVVSSQVVNRQDGFDDYRVSKAEEEGFDPRRAGGFRGRVLQPRDHWSFENRIGLGYVTTDSGMSLGVVAEHFIDTKADVEHHISTDEDVAKHVFRLHARPGDPIRIIKNVAYHTSRGAPVAELFDRCRRTLDRVKQSGFSSIIEDQRRWMDEFWETADVEIIGQPAIQQAVRWCLLQLAQATARSDQLGIAAKGVTGSGYEGHYFWDTEIYLLPFLIHTSPRVARNALRFRVNLLPQARERARVLSQDGALYPWRTINGEEASAYYAAGTAQYHIDADVAYAFQQYGKITGDTQFMYRDGAAVLVETARMWADLGFWREDRDGDRSFHIHGVTGPDEYTTVVNNNLFTNVMARANLRNAVALLEEMKSQDEAAYQRVVESLSLGEGEAEEWARCAEGMFIPWDEQFGIHPQDDKFLEGELWDLANTPSDQFPLLLNFHPLVIYRFQVLKQADVVLATFLQSEDFTAEEKRANFEYYDPITTGDSTLSGVVQSIMAAEVGYQDMAMKYFLSGLFVDLADLHGNARDGVHIASTGGVWNALIHGFAGLRNHQGAISFDPRLPQEWEALRFPLQVRGSRIRVELRATSLTLVLETGAPVEVGVRGRTVTVGENAVVVELDNQGPRLASLKAGHPEVGSVRADGSVVTSAIPESHSSGESMQLMS